MTEGIEQGTNHERDHAMAHFTDALSSLERHADITHDEHTAIAHAFNLLERGKQATITKAQEASFAVGVRLIQVLERIGYFGEQGKHFDYDTARSLAYRLGAANIRIDWGASLLILILSDLRSKETRQGVKEELSQLISEIEQGRGKPLSLQAKEYVNTLKSGLRARALAAWLLFQDPKPSANEEE